MIKLLNKNLRIRVTFFAFISIMIIQLIFLLGTYNIYGRYVIKNSISTLRITTNESSVLLNRIINSYIKPLNVLSSAPHLDTKSWEEKQKLINSNFTGFYDEIAIVNLNGHAQYVDGTNLDLSDREYINKALSGQSAISEIIESRKTGVQVIVAAVPIYNSNKTVVGALLGRIDKESLFEDIKTTGSEQLSQRFIVANNGSLIYSEASAKTYNVPISENDIQGFLYNEKNNTSDVELKRHNNENYYIIHSNIGNYQWSLYTVISEYNLLQPVRNQTNLTLVFSSMFSLVLMVTTYFVIKKEIIPLNELDQLMLRGSEGDFSGRANFNRQDEIGRLASSFNVLIEKIKTLTYFDVDTSLPNSKVFEKDYFELCNTEHLNENIGLLMIEIDGQNDGQIDLMNKHVSVYTSIVENVIKRLQQFVPTNSQLYKYIDNYFVLLVPHAEAIITQVFEEEITNFLNAYDKQESKDVHHQVYIGCAYLKNIPSYIDLIEATMAATIYAKKEAHSNIQYYSNTMLNVLKNDSEIKISISKALRFKQFCLYYQPIVSLVDQSVIKVEALIRWNHPEKGIIMPDVFIPIAESTSLIVDIDYYVIDEACRIIKEKLCLNLPTYPISINITSKTLEQNDFLLKLKSTLSRYNVDPKFIEIEITERVVMNRFNKNIETLMNIRDMGIKVSLDDFGVGYSSLSYLSKIPLDYVKIDKSFIESIGDNKMSEQLVKSIIQMCCNLELSVVAEGVETIYEADFLLKNSCLYAQGYLFSRPIPFNNNKG